MNVRADAIVPAILANKSYQQNFLPGIHCWITSIRKPNAVIRKQTQIIFIDLVSNIVKNVSMKYAKKCINLSCRIGGNIVAGNKEPKPILKNTKIDIKIKYE